MAAPQGGGGRSNVSVTSINCDTNGEYPYSAAAATNLLNGVRIAVPNLEDVSDSSDTELSKIDFAHQVTLRSKKPQQTQDGPRPMSWEGGLSDGEEEQMDTVDTQRTDGQEVTPKVESPSRAEDVKPPEFTNIYGKMMGGASDGAAPVDAHRGVACEMNLKYEPQDGSATPNGITNLFNGSIDHPLRSLHKGHNNIIPDLLGSPLLARQHKSTLIPTNPSPDSAIHSVYTHSSPSQSPLTARHAPYTPNLSRNNSDASHSSCYSYSSEFSPAHSPIQGRHMASMLHSSPLHHSVLIRPLSVDEAGTNTVLEGTIGEGEGPDEERPPHALAGAAGISRQQLINSPCPICGDKISGFHYGIFSCESCKGFFKRTVQNRKNYVCLRGASCPVSIATRKKCPACRFDKCLQRGMKLEAIREDRTRGGRSTYQCSYTLPQGTLLCPGSPLTGAESPAVRAAPSPLAANHSGSSVLGNKSLKPEPGVPPLLQEIMDVEHLWQYNESEMNRLSRGSNHVPGSAQPSVSLATNPLLASAGLAHSEDSNPDFLANLCNIADHRLYKIVKWCKSLPLFKNISIDDQICLLINSWCELLLFSCCYRSMGSPGEIRVSLGKSISLEQARHSGLQACIERMLNLTEHLRRLRIDRYEYVAMKVIVLLTSDTSELREPEKVRASQEKALQALQGYTLSHYPHSPAKFGELLLRIPELQRTCQVGKEMLTIKSKEGEGPSFNLLMELLRGEH